MSEPAGLFRAPTLSRSLVLERTWPFFLDLSVAACGLALVLRRVAHCAVLDGTSGARGRNFALGEDAAAVRVLFHCAHLRSRTC